MKTKTDPEAPTIEETLDLLLRCQSWLWQAANDAGDAPEWNEGGELYQLAHDIRAALARVA